MNPLKQLLDDRQTARSRQDPCANLCTLANVDNTGRAQARTLVLRDVDDRLAVFVNATSPKWLALEAGPVTLVVWLPTVNVQYRLSCETEDVPAAMVAESWLLRPDPPKRMDWFYRLIQPQSSRIASREALLGHLDELPLPDPLTAPAEARGLFLEPTSIERLDLSMDNGVHDRRLYTRSNPDWTEQVLAP